MQNTAYQTPVSVGVNVASKAEDIRGLNPAAPSWSNQ